MKKRHQCITIKKTVVLVLGMLFVLTNLITFYITKKYMSSENDQMAFDSSEIISSIKDQVLHMEPSASFQIDSAKAASIEDVMIVAHPDDETLWAGKHIKDKKYLIVCLTNGNNKTRSKEFAKAMELTGNYGIMLSYPDKTNNEKDNWKTVKDSIRKDIRYILNYKDWNSITTHNPEGEYGHIHHKFTNMMVTNECARLNITNKLEYFGRYYKSGYLLNHKISGQLDMVDAQAKENLMSNSYPSQAYAHKIFGHMIPYEEFISYRDWYFENR